jgi:hypothetical protein
MEECRICETTRAVEFCILELNGTRYKACFECYTQLPKPRPATRLHYVTTLCLHKGCLKYSCDKKQIDAQQYYCIEHFSESTQYSNCTRCGVHTYLHSNQCISCQRAKSFNEFQTYRTLGDLHQLKRDLDELQDYRSLGAYERFANLASRAEILDQLNIS